MVRKIVSCFILTTFVLSTFSSYVYPSQLNLPGPTKLVNLSQPYALPVLRGIHIDPKDPLNIDFLIEPGSDGVVDQEKANLLVSYFLAAVTVPKENMWVNLSAYEQNSIVPAMLSKTDLGEGMLAQDYILKQVASSITYPESEDGKAYWSEIHKQMSGVNGGDTRTVSSYNKIWVTAKKAKVYEGNNSAIIVDARLTTMLDTDYLAMQNNKGTVKDNSVAARITRTTILPKIDQDINTGKNFANLRQIYNAVILGMWFKDKFKDSFYKAYVNQEKVNGIDTADKASKDKIYDMYVEAFTKGVYNYAKKDYNPAARKITTRAYFSGGVPPGVGIGDTAPLEVTGDKSQVVLGETVTRINANLLPNGQNQLGLYLDRNEYILKLKAAISHDDNAKRLGMADVDAWQLSAIWTVHDEMSAGWRPVSAQENADYKAATGKDIEPGSIINAKDGRQLKVYRVYTGELAVTNCDKELIYRIFTFLQNEYLLTSEQVRWLMDNGWLGKRTLPWLVTAAALTVGTGISPVPAQASQSAEQAKLSIESEMDRYRRSADSGSIRADVVKLLSRVYSSDKEVRDFLAEVINRDTDIYVLKHIDLYAFAYASSKDMLDYFGDSHTRKWNLKNYNGYGYGDFTFDVRNMILEAMGYHSSDIKVRDYITQHYSDPKGPYMGNFLKALLLSDYRFTPEETARYASLYIDGGLGPYILCNLVLHSDRVAAQNVLKQVVDTGRFYAFLNSVDETIRTRVLKVLAGSAGAWILPYLDGADLDSEYDSVCARYKLSPTVQRAKTHPVKYSVYAALAVGAAAMGINSIRKNRKEKRDALKAHMMSNKDIYVLLKQSDSWVKQIGGDNLLNVYGKLLVNKIDAARFFRGLAGMQRIIMDKDDLMRITDYLIAACRHEPILLDYIDGFFGSEADLVELVSQAYDDNELEKMPQLKPRTSRSDRRIGSLTYKMVNTQDPNKKDALIKRIIALGGSRTAEVLALRTVEEYFLRDHSPDIFKVLAGNDRNIALEYYELLGKQAKALESDINALNSGRERLEEELKDEPAMIYVGGSSRPSRDDAEANTIDNPAFESLNRQIDAIRTVESKFDSVKRGIADIRDRFISRERVLWEAALKLAWMDMSFSVEDLSTEVLNALWHAHFNIPYRNVMDKLEYVKQNAPVVNQQQREWLIRNKWLGVEDDGVPNAVGGVTWTKSTIERSGDSREFYFENIPDLPVVKSMGFVINTIEPNKLVGDYLK